MEVQEQVATTDIEALRLEIQQLRTDFSTMGRTLKDIAGNVSSDAYARFRDNADRAKLRAEQAADTVTHNIEERPLASVLVALAVGVMLGLVFSRQR
jgi:ElaB/YqjD/DUF883 family membrane-anchored ribosome-binding protein